ncbi:mediator of RNA polymerase II transcription subunit 9 [Humulus lupulus]|uniref:mediator of RNA polymerase II transcription subunit 9 n=1 Tax=Humulus lupulus TaxID=3486 RepID=UPI002B41469E|nr:mediator of RNA polymerase II transcription subunit 9 [Humulus lupulus]
MEHSPYGGGGGGSWTMIPTNIQSHSNVSTPSNQDNLYVHHHQQQFQPQQSPLYQQQQPLLIQQQQQQQPQPQPQQTPPPPQQQPQQHHQSLASHFHLFHLVSKLSEAIDNGTRDQQSDALISDLNTHFEKCQQLLNSISGSISTKAMTVDGQKKKLEESEQMLNQRRDLMNKYIHSVQALVKSQP